MMSTNCKLMIAGVGGQGIVYLTNIIVEAAVSAKIPVAASEIHGLAQRGGSVVAGVTFGKNTYGFIEEGGADYLIGLEPLEAQRCLPYLHKKSRSVIDNRTSMPHSVNEGLRSYPDTKSFIKYITTSTDHVDFISKVNGEVDSMNRNVYVLGRATQLKEFPLAPADIKNAIMATGKKARVEQSIKAFQLGCNDK